MGQGDPFCSECGRVSPGLLSRGDRAFEIQEVPGERLRNEVLQMLRTWFPGIDASKAADQLKSGSVLLTQGIDEESGLRIQAALKAVKVQGRLIDPEIEKSWFRRLINPGLGIAAAFLLLAGIIKGLTGIVLLVGAAASPFAWALLRPSGREPLFVFPGASLDADRWIKIAHEYSQVMDSLQPEDAAKLASLSEAAFDIQRLLREDSLASVAAGEERGDLYQRISEAIQTAIAISRRLSTAPGEDAAEPRSELDGLADAVRRTREWFLSVDRGESRTSEQVSDDLQQIREGIDQVLEHVRPSSETLRLPSTKTPA